MSSTALEIAMQDGSVKAIKLRGGTVHLRLVLSITSSDRRMLGRRSRSTDPPCLRASLPVEYA